MITWVILHKYRIIFRLIPASVQTAVKPPPGTDRRSSGLHGDRQSGVGFLAAAGFCACRWGWWCGWDRSTSKHSVAEGAGLRQEEQCRFTGCWCDCSSACKSWVGFRTRVQACTQRSAHERLHAGPSAFPSSHQIICWVKLFIMSLLFLKSDFFYNEFV